MLASLESQVDPKHTAVIVVDVQNDYCAGGGALHLRGNDVSLAQEMVPRLGVLLEEARRVGTRIIWVKMLNLEWTASAVRRACLAMTNRTTISSCQAGTWGQDYYELRPAPGDIEISKYRYSAFIGTNLDLILRSLQIKTLIMTGVATNVCVESTARDGYMMDYYVVFLDDCTAAFKPEAHQATLDNMAEYFGIVTSSTEVINTWRTERSNAK
ncbi:MAG: cysteine hydrolase [Chloroflexi bacterium]|nr:cysteine hydrolase [Chloroflexota bacterium]